MAQEIFILGGLPIDFDRSILLDRLRASSGNAYEWEWFKTIASDGWRVAPKYLNTFRWKVQQPSSVGAMRPKVVVLRSLNRETSKSVSEIESDPILVPAEVQTGEQLIAWLLSPDAGIIPTKEWFSGTNAATFICILVKLIRNKSFNKDTHGHAWTQEADLLGQAPVNVPGRSIIRAMAPEILEKMDGTLLISKGGHQGKTKKEWGINTLWLPAIKRVILERSFSSLNHQSALASIMNRVNINDGQSHPLHEIVGEKVLAICRENTRKESTVP